MLWSCFMIIDALAQGDVVIYLAFENSACVTLFFQGQDTSEALLLLSLSGPQKKLCDVICLQL